VFFLTKHVKKNTDTKLANIDLNQVSGIDIDKTQLISIDGETTRSLNVFFKNFFKVLDKLK